MRAAPLPPDEHERLDALAGYEILDTPPEEAFDRITRLAAEILQTPLAVINFVDEHRQWGKSCVGVHSTQAPRAASFCAWAILSDHGLVVTNTSEDERFFDNPMVLGVPNIGAYAGVPLVNRDGYRLGTLCVTTPEPRQFSEKELSILRSLAALAMDELELRARTRDLERQLARNAELLGHLERTNNELDAFTRSVSHDLRAPVRHIQGFTGLLKRALANGDVDQVTRYANVIDSAAGRMSSLIEDLLDFSRYVEKPLRMQCLELDDLVAEVLESLEPDTRGRHIEWCVAPLPEVQADETLLRQVFLNLLGNAVKYSRQKEEARIEVRAETNDEEHVIHVRDNGAGFDPQFKDRLFGVFQRLHRQDEFEGTGVGLAIVQRVVHRHGGRIWADGEVGQGATFSFSIPKVQCCS